MDGHHSDFLVIGAGMAGLACATALARGGASVTVLDKGRGPGGRMAARRVEIGGESISFDHGAQYFTARDPAFREAVAAWEHAGVAARWPAAGDDAWVGVPGMNAPIRAMAGSEAEGLDVRWNTRAERITRDGARWLVHTEGQRFVAKTVLVAVPAEQTAVLLADAAPAFARLAGAVQSAPCWAVMAAFADRLPITLDCFRSETGPVSWAARNSAKPGRPVGEAWVIHASPARSRALVDRAKDEVAEIVLADFFSAASTAPVEPLHRDAHRWLYALPEAPTSRGAGEGARFDAALGLGIAGDWLHSPRVEGAWLSGRALAEMVLAAS